MASVKIIRASILVWGKLFKQLKNIVENKAFVLSGFQNKKFFYKKISLKSRRNVTKPTIAIAATLAKNLYCIFEK